MPRSARVMAAGADRRRGLAVALLATAGALSLAGGWVGMRDARAAGTPRPAATPVSASPTAPAVPDSRHYLTTELDVRPGIKVRVQPPYPARAARENMSGKAVVQLFIDSNGGVEKVAIERAAPDGYGFGESAARAFRAARFSPAMKDGKRVRVQMRIEVSFDAPPPASGKQKQR
jgi:protein TonB